MTWVLFRVCSDRPPSPERAPRFAGALEEAAADEDAEAPKEEPMTVGAQHGLFVGDGRAIFAHLLVKMLGIQ